MTENKRFKFICDDENCFFKDMDNVIDCYEVCNLLNEFDKENKELKLQYSNLKRQKDEFFKGAMENASCVKQLEEEVDYWKKRALLLENKYGERVTQKKNLFTVINHCGMLMGETKTNYLLPIQSTKALCIMFNYLYRHGELPTAIDTGKWWENEEFQEYYEEAEWDEE